MNFEIAGGRAVKGASIKVFLITLPTSYDAGGSAMDLSTYFPKRVYWAVPMSPFFINATTGAACVGLVPGTAKTDRPKGYASSDWKVRAFATATELSGNLSAYTGYIVACGV
jgi:hypothetical protein